MPIDEFKRIANYFSTTDKVRADGLDTQCNLISDYLNKKVLPILNDLTSDSIPGSTNPADLGKYLQNVGDGTTRWAAIDNDAIADGALSFSKLVKANPGSILASGVDQVIKPIAPTEANQVLVSRANDAPVWKKLTGDNLEDRSIGANHITDNSITGFNIARNVLSTQLINNNVTNIKLQNGALLARHLQNNFATADKFTLDTLNKFTSGTIVENWMSNSFVSGTLNIPDATIHQACFKGNFINLDAKVIKDGTFSLAEIADGMIVDQFIADGTIGVNMYSYYPTDRPDPIYGLYGFAVNSFIDWGSFPPDDPNNWIVDELIDETFFPPKVRNKIG